MTCDQQTLKHHDFKHRDAVVHHSTGTASTAVTHALLRSTRRLGVNVNVNVNNVLATCDSKPPQTCPNSVRAHVAAAASAMDDHGWQA